MLTVVVPTFNEGKNIKNLVKQIDAALKDIDYVRTIHLIL